MRQYSDYTALIEASPSIESWMHIQRMHTNKWPIKNKLLRINIDYRLLCTNIKINIVVVPQFCFRLVLVAKLVAKHRFELAQQRLRLRGEQKLLFWHESDRLRGGLGVTQIPADMHAEMRT